MVVRRDALTPAHDNNEGYYAVPGLAPAPTSCRGTTSATRPAGDDRHRRCGRSPRHRARRRSNAGIDVSADRREDRVASARLHRPEAKALRRILDRGAGHHRSLAPAGSGSVRVTAGSTYAAAVPSTLILRSDHPYNPTTHSASSRLIPTRSRRELYSTPTPRKVRRPPGLGTDGAIARAIRRLSRDGVSLIAARAGGDRSNADRGFGAPDLSRSVPDMEGERSRRLFLRRERRINRSFGTDNVILSGYAGSDDLTP